MYKPTLIKSSITVVILIFGEISAFNGCAGVAIHGYSCGSVSDAIVVFSPALVLAVMFYVVYSLIQKSHN